MSQNHLVLLKLMEVLLIINKILFIKTVCWWYLLVNIFFSLIQEEICLGNGYCKYYHTYCRFLSSVFDWNYWQKNPIYLYNYSCIFVKYIASAITTLKSITNYYQHSCVECKLLMMQTYCMHRSPKPFLNLLRSCWSEGKISEYTAIWLLEKAKTTLDLESSNKPNTGGTREHNETQWGPLKEETQRGKLVEKKSQAEPRSRKKKWRSQHLDYCKITI